MTAYTPAPTCLFVYLTAVFHFKCAGATRLSHFRSRSAESVGCTNYSIPVDAKPSGWGKLWEYYHFMVDFAPSMYYHMRHDAAHCKQLYVPGWHTDNKFNLTLQDGRSMQEKFDSLLGVPLNITLVPVAAPEEMRGLVAQTNVTLIPWNCHAGGTQWANQCEYYFTEFRSYAVKLLGNPILPIPLWSDAVVVNRAKIPGYNGPKTGYDRRHLSEEFYQSLLEDMSSQGSNSSKVLVKSFETATTAEQVHTFSNTMAIVAQHGAALSNMLFAPPHTLVVEVGHRAFNCYKTLAEKLGLNYVWYQPTNYSEIIGDSLKQRKKDVLKLIKSFSSWQQGKTPLSDNSMLEGILCPAHFSCSGRAFRGQSMLPDTKIRDPQCKIA